MKYGTVIIHFICPSHPGEDENSCLSADERARAQSFKFGNDAARWTSFRIGVRKILGETLDIAPGDVPIQIDSFGKPTLAPPFNHLHFNLSHCDDLGLLAICLDGPVGIDIEPSLRAPDLLECVESFCHPSEIAALPTDPHPRSLALLELWCAKEALLKAHGSGLMQAPDEICLHASGGLFELDLLTPLREDSRFKTTLLTHPLLEHHCAALSAPPSAAHMEFAPPPLSTGPS